MRKKTPEAPQANIEHFRVHASRRERTLVIAARMGLSPDHPKVQKFIAETAEVDLLALTTNAATLAADARTLAPRIRELHAEVRGFSVPLFREAARHVARAARELERAAEVLDPPRRRKRS